MKLEEKRIESCCYDPFEILFLLENPVSYKILQKEIPFSTILHCQIFLNMVMFVKNDLRKRIVILKLKIETFYNYLLSSFKRSSSPNLRISASYNTQDTS